MSESTRVFVAGHRGLVGGALCRALERRADTEILTRSRDELDLRDTQAVDAFFAAEKPDRVFLAAAKVGGIRANDAYPAEFIRDNLQIQTNVIDAAWRHGVSKLCFLGSSCIYPREAPQPMSESVLLTGPLEPTNQWYALAKIAGLKMCQAYRRQYGFSAISLMPTNLYGPGDNFSLSDAHVLPALLRRFDAAATMRAKSVVLWGTGTARREFLHVDDFADAAVHLMDHYDHEDPINVGTGEDLTIRALAELVAETVGFDGEIEFDATHPDGTPRKLLDVTRVHRTGWRHRIPLQDGVRDTYRWFRDNRGMLRA
jgi:GDP-L-fucose synthase